jgi:hypothetical protein
MIKSYISKYSYGYPYARLGFALSTIYLVDFDGGLGSERLLDEFYIDRSKCSTVGNGS